MALLSGCVQMVPGFNDLYEDLLICRDKFRKPDPFGKSVCYAPARTSERANWGNVLKCGKLANPIAPPTGRGGKRASKRRLAMVAALLLHCSVGYFYCERTPDLAFNRNHMPDWKRNTASYQGQN